MPAPDSRRAAALRRRPQLQCDREHRGGSRAGPPKGRTCPHPPTPPLCQALPASCPRRRAGSVVGKLRAPGFHPAPPSNVWAGRRVRVLFVCDYWGARVEASSCLHVRVCALGHAWIPVGPVRVSRPVPCGHVLVHACAGPGCCGLGNAHDLGMPIPGSLCTRANAEPTVGDLPGFKRPCQETSVQTSAV